MKTLGPLACLALIASCSGIKDVTARNVDVVLSPDFDRRGWVGTHTVTIHTIQDVDVEPWTIRTDGGEMTDIPCTLQGHGFSARFLSPAKVNLPDLGYRSKPVQGACDSNGVIRRFDLRPVNITQRSGHEDRGLVNQVLGAFFEGAMLEAARYTLNNERNDDFGYEGRDVHFPDPETGTKLRAPAAPALHTLKPVAVSNRWMYCSSARKPKASPFL